MSPEEVEALKKDAAEHCNYVLVDESEALEKYVNEKRIQKVYWTNSNGIRYTWGPVTKQKGDGDCHAPILTIYSTFPQDANSDGNLQLYHAGLEEILANIDPLQCDHMEKHGGKK
ncbi:hypothetical protein M7I_6361 [Glarea lozoyensis 74030]|uniref:Uncharacterized protein n=1 Tax=Glarea lozoyensis (strain ATCC 74030 / MF5533) TaxID=1104152 RepID=H0EUC7_GLAL7|nr:hypothetical protein M7I_6361 [Glarea lozoyensis 74030]